MVLSEAALAALACPGNSGQHSYLGNVSIVDGLECVSRG